MNIGCSWSGGKDSCFALMRQLELEDDLRVLLNVMDENRQYSKSHGLSQNILHAQARAIGVPLQLAAASWTTYEENFIANLQAMKLEHQLQGMVYGDIDISSHRLWEEKVSNAAGIEAYLPLWQGDRRQLVEEMIDAGIKAIIVSCNHELGTAFLGEEINLNLLNRMENIGIDVCGENGEYHTLVIDCPLFNEEIKIEKGKSMKTDNYCFIEINLAS